MIASKIVWMNSNASTFSYTDARFFLSRYLIRFDKPHLPFALSGVPMLLGT